MEQAQHNEVRDLSQGLIEAANEEGGIQPTVHGKGRIQLSTHTSVEDPSILANRAREGEAQDQEPGPNLARERDVSILRIQEAALKARLAASHTTQ